MIILTKSKACLALGLVTLAMFMIVSTVTYSDVSVFELSKRSHTHEGIGQGCSQPKHSQEFSANPNSPLTRAANNIGACANINLGGNTGAHEQ